MYYVMHLAAFCQDVLMKVSPVVGTCPVQPKSWLQNVKNGLEKTLHTLFLL